MSNKQFFTIESRSACSKINIPSLEIIPCNEKTFCKARDLICKTDYKGEEGIQAAYCTAITDYPEKRSLFWGYMSAVDNNMAEWKGPMLAALKHYALHTNCDCVEFFSTRTGWNKIFEDAGATVENIGTIYEVTLDDK